MGKAHDSFQESRTLDVAIEEQITFSDMLLSESTLAGLEAMGFRKPSPVQKEAIPYGKCGYDLLIQAKSGTGKTCVFSVIAMEMLNPNLKKLQAVIIAPTREISVQICDVVSSLSRYMGKLKVESFIGGLPLDLDKSKLSKCQIAVGAPGRMKHLISTNLMDLRSVRLFVLDEADRLMEQNFRKDISYIYSKLPSNKQMIAASATFSEELQNFVVEMMKKPVKINPSKDSILLGVRQFAAVIPSHAAVYVQMKNKTKELIRILSSISFKQCLVFSNYQSRAESVCAELTQEGWPAIYINGSQTQMERLKVFNSLKDYRCRILLSTDLTSRGIDAENVNLIVNLDLPYDGATYTHRIGRAGRYGTYGLAVTILQEGDEVERFRHLLNEIGGEDFHVFLFPKAKLNFDMWTAGNENFEKLTALSGKYIFKKMEKENRSESVIGVSDIGNKMDVFSMLLKRLPRPRKLSIYDFQTLDEDLKNFNISEMKLKISQEEQCETVKMVPGAVDFNLIHLEKKGWKSFYGKHKLLQNVNFNSCKYKDEICTATESYDSCNSTSDDELDNSVSSLDSSDEENEMNYDKTDFSQINFNTELCNWHSMWLQQAKMIRNYVQYYHYLREMINFK